MLSTRDTRKCFRGLLLLVAISAVMTTTACGGGDGAQIAAEDTIIGSGEPRWPSDTLPDVVSYADQVVVATVLAEAPTPLTGPAADVGQGYAGRLVRLDIERTLWQRSDGPEPSSSDVVVAAMGWVLKDGRRYPAASSYGSRMEVGGRYVIPITIDRFGDWNVLNPDLISEVQDSQVIGPAQEPSFPAADAFRGQSLDEVGRLLATARPDPLAVRHGELEPDQRVVAVLRDKGLLTSEEAAALERAHAGISRRPSWPA